MSKVTQTLSIGLVLLFTVGCWTARGILERKPPSFFEAMFASIGCIALLADPTAAKKLTIRALERIAEQESGE